MQNLLVADRERIALYVTGRVPIRRAGDGSAPVPGDGSHDWIGWASGEQLPHIVAPASGRLVNANDRIAPPDFPVFLGRDWFGDWRAARIRELLARSDRHTAADFARMQVDVHSRLRPPDPAALLAVPVTDDTAAARPGVAARLGRQHDGGRAAAADLQRLDAPLLRPRPASRPASRRAMAARWWSSLPMCCRRPARTGAAAIARPRCRLHWPTRSPISRAASATIPRYGAGARHIRRCSPIRCCARCRSWAR